MESVSCCHSHLYIWSQIIWVSLPVIPVRTFDTQTWLFFPEADLWEDETPTKKSKTWIANVLPLLISIIALYFSHISTNSLLFVRILLSLSLARWGVLLYGLIEVKMWRTYTDTNWGHTKKFSACVGWLNAQKKSTHEKNILHRRPSRPKNIIFIYG